MYGKTEVEPETSTLAASFAAFFPHETNNKNIASKLILRTVKKNFDIKNFLRFVLK